MNLAIAPRCEVSFAPLRLCVTLYSVNITTLDAIAIKAVIYVINRLSSI